MIVRSRSRSVASAAAVAAVSARAADPTLTLAGPGAGPVVLLLAVAAALAGAGAAAWRRRPQSAVGPLLLGAAVAWCAAQLDDTRRVVARVHARARARRGGARRDRAGARAGPSRGRALAFATVGLLGVLSALVFDPQASGCVECPANLLLVHGAAGLFDGLQRAGLWLGLAAIAWLLLTAAPRVRLAAVTAYLLAVAAQYVHSIPRGYLAADATDRALWTLQGLALLGVAAAVAGEPVRERRARARLARLVVELESRPGPRGLQEVLGVRARRRRPAHRLPARRRPPARRRRPAGRACARAGRHVAGGGRAVPPARACSTIPRSSPRSPSRRGSRCAASACTRSCRRGSRTCGRSAAASSPPGTASGGGSSAISTTAPSSGSPRSRSRSRSRARGRAATAPQRSPPHYDDVRAALAALREVAHGLVPPVLADEGLGPAVEAFAETARRVRRRGGAADRGALRARGRGHRVPSRHRGGAARRQTPPSAPGAATAGCACRSTPRCPRGTSSSISTTASARSAACCA